MLHSATWKDSPFHVDDPGRLQMTLVAATASSAVSNLVRKILPEALMLRTSGVHRVPPGVKQRFFDVSEMGQRDALIVNVRECLKWIAKTLQRSGKGEQEKVGGSIMIFCNTKASCSFVHEQLKAEGIRHASIHGDLSKDERFVQMNMFAEGQVPVLVATDLASRGMHLQTVRVCNVPHVRARLHTHTLTHAHHHHTRPATGPRCDQF
jgi:superfamily II DNA/RNA helicase